MKKIQMGMTEKELFSAKTSPL